MWKSIKIHWISFIFICLLASGLLVSLQYARGDHFPDPDGFYHAKASQLLQQGKLSNHFPWSYYSTWKDGYADQHYVYHWLIVPFNTINVLSWSVVVFGLVFTLAFYGLLIVLRVVGKPVWIFVVLLGSVDFLFRINLVKANTLSLALLCAIAALAYLWHYCKSLPARWMLIVCIALISGVFTWTYGGFVCVPLFLGAYCISASLYKKRIVITPLLASLLGIFLGLVSHPHSSNLLSLMYDQLFLTGLGAGSKVPAGNEWLPFEISWFIKSNILIIVFWVLSLFLTLQKLLGKREFIWEGLWFQIVSCGFLFLALWHRRFIEYWIPFAVVSTAITFTPYLLKLRWQNFWAACKAYWQFQLLVILFLLATLAVVNFNLKHTIAALRNGGSGVEFKAASQYMAEHSQDGDIIFNTQWDQLPQLFYWNSKDYYIVGLDPTFMYIHNQDLYWKWRTVVDDADQKWGSMVEVKNTMQQDFHARYVFIEKDRNPNLYHDLSQPGSGFGLEYESEDVAVFGLN